MGGVYYNHGNQFFFSHLLAVSKSFFNYCTSDKLLDICSDYFKEKYGDWILYDPGVNKNTYFLWLLPLLIFLFGGTIIYKKLIKKI